MPNPKLKDDEVELGYSCFYVMFKFKIIYYLMRIHGISLARANSMWEAGFDFDPHIYEVMKMIIEIEHPSVIINRNPTLMVIWCRKTSLIDGEVSLCLNYQTNVVIC